MNEETIRYLASYLIANEEEFLGYAPETRGERVIISNFELEKVIKQFFEELP